MRPIDVYVSERLTGKLTFLKSGLKYHQYKYRMYKHRLHFNFLKLFYLGQLYSGSSPIFSKDIFKLDVPNLSEAELISRLNMDSLMLMFISRGLQTGKELIVKLIKLEDDSIRLLYSKLNRLHIYCRAIPSITGTDIYITRRDSIERFLRYGYENIPLGGYANFFKHNENIAIYTSPDRMEAIYKMCQEVFTDHHVTLANLPMDNSIKTTRVGFNDVPQYFGGGRLNLYRSVINFRTIYPIVVVGQYVDNYDTLFRDFGCTIITIGAECRFPDYSLDYNSDEILLENLHKIKKHIRSNFRHTRTQGV